MKKAKYNEGRPEYKREELGKGVRGKYFKNYQKGSNLVLLSPDVAAGFPDDQSVNAALRALLTIAQQNMRPAKRASRLTLP